MTRCAAAAAAARGAPAVLFALLVATLLLLIGTSADNEAIVIRKRLTMVGMQKCTYGPSFWCQNITNAAGCNAVKHCIETTWTTHKYPEDTDDVCTICKNMVKEARDTLTSNATLDELRQVFYGSCQLLPLKVIKTECKKLADDFIPELVDTLASEMDPNVVCTVSGLCNNDRIDKLLLENTVKEQPEVNSEYHQCEQCVIVMDKSESLLQGMPESLVINKILMMCGELSSFSEMCGTIVLNYRNEIYNSIKDGFTKRNVCMLSGMCSEAFHPHAVGYEKSKNALMGVEISNAGERGRIQFQKPNQVSDDLTCEFCETLVKHLRDVLIANTTEDQFLDVLKGLCKQTKTFSNKCLSIVNDDYKRIYQFLVSELNGNVLCSIVGICPSKSSDYNYGLDYIVPMFPIIPIEFLQTPEATKIKEDESISKIDQNKQKSIVVTVDEQPPTIHNIEPIKKSPVIDVFYKEMHFVFNTIDIPTEKTLCFLCQSVLNYVQQVVTDPKSENEIRNALEKSCTVIPQSFKQQCIQFIDQYGDAFISLIAQEVDPSIICPELKVCPNLDLTLISTPESESSNNCPMCVLFMSALESEISNKDTEKEIKIKLENLCTKLPSKWKDECTNFVSSQLESILDMLIAQMKPEEICVLLDVCKPKTISESLADNSVTNMIADSDQVTIVFPGYNMGQLLANNYKMLEEPKVPTPLCIVCTVAMKYLNTEVQDKSNQEEIEKALDSICSILPNIEEDKCQNFINTNYKQIITAIQVGTNPTIACMALMVCEQDRVIGGGNHDIGLIKENVQPTKTPKESMEFDKSDECVACEMFITVFDACLNKDSSNIDKIDLNTLCDNVEILYRDQCLEMLGSYGASFKNLYNLMPTWMMCEELWLCGKNKSVAVHQFENSNCLNGAKYWCESLDNAKECKVGGYLNNLIRYSCTMRTKDPNNDWLLGSLMETLRTKCIEHCVKKPNEFHPKCAICKDVIHDIKNKIENSPAEEAIKYRLEGLCTTLPPPKKSKCVELVETYTDKFVNTVIDDINEESVCTEIGYC